MKRIEKMNRLGVEPDWITAAQEGDKAAFRHIYDATLPSVVRQVARLARPSEVEDIVQDVFISVHRCLSSFRGEAAFSTWLYRVTRNVTIDHLRRQREVPVELNAIRNLRKTGEFWKKLEARDLLRSLQAALQSVDLEHREAFYLYEVEGRKLREVAELTEASIHTVASRVRRTRERLQALLESDRREAADG